MKRIFLFLGAMALMAGFAGNASATMFDRGGGLIYDDFLNITWLQDANYALTSGYDAGGTMSWYEATAWADGLEYYDTVRDVIWNDWRLPSAIDMPCVVNGIGASPPFYNIDSSEMGHMYYVNLGNLGTLSNTGPFVNFTEWKHYWSNTWAELTQWAVCGSYWTFDFESGAQQAFDVADNWISAWAVRNGDVAMPVPEPACLLLLSTGLVGLAGLRIKRRNADGIERRPN